MSGAAVDAEYAALASDYDEDWAAYNRATTERTLRALRDRAPGDRGDEPGRALDVGCGTGALLARLTPAAATAGVGLDRSAEMLAVARRRLSAASLVRGEATALPFPDAAFAAAVTNSSLHYADDPAAGVRELARVVRPGGTVVWTDWDGGALTTRGVVAWLRLTRRPLGRVLSATAMAEALRDAGLTDVRLDRWRHGWLWGLATVSGRKPG
ncbi:methyltransferase domain-containing protein [Alienimonas sp. DA493]|uniref:methyltransferase domain-containing protein n=1 Tax=Alienimonas sp. DA493 TaxID=3373605 RepID=UPI003754BCB0